VDVVNWWFEHLTTSSKGVCSYRISWSLRIGTSKEDFKKPCYFCNKKYTFVATFIIQMNMSIVLTCFRYHVSKQTPNDSCISKPWSDICRINSLVFLGKCLRYSSSDIISLRLIIVFLRANFVDFVDNRR